MVTFTSSGNSTANPFDFGSSSTYASCGVKLTDGLTPDFTGTYGTSITLAIRAAAGAPDAGTSSYKGFVQTAGGSTTFTDAKSFSYPSFDAGYDSIEFDLPSEEIEDDGIVGITITDETDLDCQCWDNTNQSGDYIPQRGNSSASMGNIRVGMTVTIVASATAPASNITFPQIPESKYIKNSAFKS